MFAPNLLFFLLLFLFFSFLFFFFFPWFWGEIMLAAVQNGDAEKLAELMKQNPDFKVNMDRDGDGWTLLHYACYVDSRSAVIPLLLAHPDIDVNAKNMNGSTPFYGACIYGSTSCVCDLLKDSRVKLNEPNNNGYTPLWAAANWGHLDVIGRWIASGREVDFGKPGEISDAIGAAEDRGETEVVALLERFKENPVETRHAMRVELGLLDELAAEVFALVVFVSDGLLQIKETTITTPASRFFAISRRLPLELPNDAVLWPGGISKGDHGRQGTRSDTLVILVKPMRTPLPSFSLSVT